MFLHVSVSHSVHRGACVAAGGHAWLWGGMHSCQGVCMVGGGMHGWGACMVAEGHVWLLGGVHGWGGMHGCWGMCMVVGGHAWDMMRYGQ